MSIVYLQPIFAPDKSRLQRNLDSIKSFANYCTKNPYPNLKIVLGGWAQEEYWPEIQIAVRDSIGPGIKIKKFDKNYGKATVVNTLHESIANETHDFILTADSDIIFDETQPNLFERLVEVSQESAKNRKIPFGLISLNQLAQNCHLPNCVYQNRQKYSGKYGEEEFVWPSGNGGIAGGCLFISSKCWKDVGGYRVMGVYAGDDAYFLIDTIQKGYSIQMFETGKIIHPHDHDQEYAQWKVKVCQRDSGITKQDINIQIDEANSFWDTKYEK